MVELPWVSELSPIELLRLREDAKSALPAFRSLLARELNSQSKSPEEDAKRVIGKLKDEVAAIEGELSVLKNTSGDPFRLATGALGLSMILYGVSQDANTAVSGLGALLTAWVAAHPEIQKDKRETETLKVKPGYLLLRAREMLRHENPMPLLPHAHD